MTTLLQDLRYALRQFRKSPGFTAIAVISLALAIGANTTVFSYANQQLYARLGVPHPDQLRLFSVKGDEHIAIHDMSGNGSIGSNPSYLDSFTYPVFRQLRQQNAVTQEIFAFSDLPSVNITLDGEARVGAAELVSGNFYTQMQLHPQLGRGILASDDGAPGTGSVAVISDAFWHSAFGARDVLGKTLRINTVPLTIVGVNPPEYTSAQAGLRSMPELFLPLSLASVLNPGSGESDPTGPELWWLQLMARAKPGISDARAQAALDVALGAAVRGTTIVAKDETLPHIVMQDGSHGDNFGIAELARPTYILLGMAGGVLLLACANLANLMLARATARQREMAVRMALGAGRGRLLRQLFTESLILASLGGTAGLVLGYLGRNVIPWLMQTGWEGSDFNVQFDWRVFGFTAAITLTTGLLFGLAPALRASRTSIESSLKEGNRTATRSRKSLAGKFLVVFQITLSTLLVMCSALFVRTIVNLRSVDPGFRVHGLTLFNIVLPGNEYPAPKDIATQTRIREAVAAIPGVENATFASVPLVAGSMSMSSFDVEGAPKPSTKSERHTQSALRNTVGENFFSTLGIPILAGRGLGQQDTATSLRVAVVNQALAQKFFPNTDPIGKRFRTGSDDADASSWLEIVGVCGDTHYQDLKEGAMPPVYFQPYRQAKQLGAAIFTVRSSLSPQALLPSLRHALQQIDPNLPLKGLRTQDQQIADTMQQEKLFASLTFGFGLLALALACVGIYGIMSYTVSQRTNEIGIRLALGAVRGQIQSMVLREATWIAATGVVLGLGLALLSARLVKAMLYGVTPYDPVSLAGSALVLLSLALFASWVPAYRASQVNPIDALRSE